MPRLMLFLMAATGLGASPTDDEPKPPTASPSIAESFKKDNEAAGQSPPARVFVSEARDRGLIFQGVGQEFRFRYDQDADLKLVAPDDALRAHLKLPKDRGLVATSVRENGPAWQAGVRENDILLSLNFKPLVKPEDLEEKLKQAGGKPLVLELLRKGAPVSLTIRPQIHVRAVIGPAVVEPAYYLIGMDVNPAEPALRAQLDLPDHQGAVVTAVAKDGPAEKSGFKLNDVILTVAGQPQQDLKTLWDVVTKSDGKTITVEFLREGVRRTVEVTPEKGRTTRSAREALKVDQVTTIVRPGVFQAAPSIRFDGEPIRIGLRSAAAPDPSAKRLDEMAADIKELRQAIDGLRKAIEERK